MKSASMIDITSKLQIRIHTTHNDSFVAYLDSTREADDIGALYYVVAVVLIYALSIVMMIASHIRKNQQDSQLRTYLKEMAILRKKDRRDKIVGKLAKPTVIVSKPNSGSTPPVGNAVHILTPRNPDVECRESLLGKNSNSDDTNDSVFQTSGDFCIDLSKPENLTPKHQPKPCVQIHVINENVSL